MWFIQHIHGISWFNNYDSRKTFYPLIILMARVTINCCALCNNFARNMNTSKTTHTHYPAAHVFVCVCVCTYVYMYWLISFSSFLKGTQKTLPHFSKSYECRLNKETYSGACCWPALPEYLAVTYNTYYLLHLSSYLIVLLLCRHI